MAVRDTYHHLLFEYASGALDEAHALLVAAHVSLSPNARRIVQEYESIGGGLLQECCAPIAMDCNALENVFNRIECLQDECTEIERRQIACREADMLPTCMHAYIDIHETSLHWEKDSAHIQVITLQTTSCTQSRARLLRLAPGAALHAGYDVLLVLEGALIEAGQIFTRGDIILPEQRAASKTRADKTAGCLCLVLYCSREKETPKKTSNFFSFLKKRVGRF